MHVTTPNLQLSARPAAQVLRAARVHGPVFRDATAELTGLSVSTVNRQVSVLLKAGLVRERADLAPAGAVGRPRLPFEVNPDLLAVGIHVGFKATSFTVHDLHYRVVDAISVPTPAGSPAERLAAIGDAARRFADRWPRCNLLWAGVAIGGRVTEGGLVDHPLLGFSAAPVGRIIAERTGLPVSVASHVEAMAAAELAVNPPDQGRNFLYFYAREMTGIAFTLDGAVYTPTAGPAVIGHFPTGPTRLLDPERTGQLENAVSDTALLEAATDAGLRVGTVDDLLKLARDGDETARALFVERAEVLGRAVGLFSDIFNPDYVIIGGQAFTDYPEALPVVARSIRETSVAERRDVRVAQSENTVQQKAAGAVALDAVFSDPVEATVVSSQTVAP